MAKGIPAGQAYFTLTLNDQLSQKISGIGSRLKATLGRITAAATAFTAGFTAVAGAVTALGAAIVGLGRKFANYGDNFQKMAIRTDIGTEALQELSYAAEISGTNIDALSQALFRARRRIGNAALGTGPAARALELLGVNAKELAKQKPEQQLEELVRVLEQVENEAQRNQLAFELFGDNFRQIQPLVDQGVDGLRALRQEARDFGIIDNQSIQRSAELTDAFFRLTRVVDMLKISLGNAFSPALIEIMNTMAKMIGTLSKQMILFGRVSAVTWGFFKRQAFDVLTSVMKPMAEVLAFLGDEGAQEFLAGIDWARAGLTEDIGKAYADLLRGFADDAMNRSYAEQSSSNVIPSGFASSQILSGFTAAMASRLNLNTVDPKKEEKQMVGLLEQIRDDGLIVGAGDGG